MSTVKATHFEHPSASTAGITLAADGSVVLPQGFTGGIGSNVVQTVKTDTQVISGAGSSSWSVVGGGTNDLEVTITPSSATSRVLVIASLSITQSVGATVEEFVAVTLFRDSTNLAVPDSLGTRIATLTAMNQIDAIGGNRAVGNRTIMFLDSPATTSATTYSVQQLRATSGLTYINRPVTDADNNYRSRAVSVITAIEVAA